MKIHHHDEHEFSIDVQDPSTDVTYEWLLSIDILPLHPAAGIEFMPFVQVRNFVEVIDSGEERGSNFERSTPSGTWKWQADGDYLWNWTERQVKEVNFEAYARVL